MDRKLGVMGILCVVLSLVSFGVSEGPPLLPEMPDVTVDSGVVIAYGERINPPYRAWLDGDQLFLNFFLFAPRPNNPEVEGRAIAVSPEQQQRHEIIEAIAEEYVALYVEGGKQQAEDQVMSTFRGHDFLLSMKFEDRFLILGFADGHVEWMDMASHVEGTLSRERVMAELVEARGRLQEGLLEMLESGRAVAFGYDYTIYIAPVVFQQLEEIVSALRSGEWSKAHAECRWIELLGEASQAFFDDVLAHLDTWGEV
jgi:hypothetical protein